MPRSTRLATKTHDGRFGAWPTRRVFLPVVASTMLALSGVAAVSATAGASAPVTLFVSTTGTATTGCTTTGAGACPTVAEAVSAAEALSGVAVTIDIAAGTYDTNLVIDDPTYDNPSLTLQGAGPATTILDGTHIGITLQLEQGNTTIDDLSIIDGAGSSYGGAISNSGALTMTNDILSDSNGGDGGGGIYNASGDQLSVSDSTFAHDSGYDGGAITSFGSVTLTGDTFSSDSAQSSGAGVYLSGGTNELNGDTFSSDSAESYGGAVFSTGTTTLTNDTLTGDTATFEAGGAVLSEGSATFLDDTLANDTVTDQPNYGGGIFVYSGTASFANSILDNANCARSFIASPIVDSGYNVSSDGTCGFGNLSLQDSSTIDLATSLAANGSTGPETLALSPGSAAIDEVPHAACTVTTDERGTHRPGKAGQTACDAGAFELVPAKPSAPLKLVAASGKDAITLTWATPTSNGGAALNQYRAYCQKQKPVVVSGAVSGVVAPTADTITIRSLTAGKKYYCVVEARNSVGVSAPSATVSATPKA